MSIPMFILNPILSPESRSIHDESATCLCVAEHRPPVLEFERHHVFPLYLGGDENGETVWVCPNAHANCHELIRLMLRFDHILTDHELQYMQPRPVSRYAAALAREGFRRWASTTSSGHYVLHTGDQDENDAKNGQ